jgi:ribonuclease J
VTPGKEDLWFLPLGGCGEIGMNFNLYGHDGHWLIIDCGLSFSELPGESGQRSASRVVQMADPAFIVERRDEIAGMIITHAHEDHIGAVPLLWPQLQCPIYTTAFTGHVLRRKLAEARIEDVPVHLVRTGQHVDIGPFSVEWLGLTHSIPEPHGMVIRTPAGKIFHSGDWKLDDAPVVGERYDLDRCRALGADAIDAIVCDSTNANVDGHSGSESDLYPGLKQIVENASGRVIVTCFGSNLARVATLARIADETDRHLGLLGRSMIEMVTAAKAQGLLPDARPNVDPEHLGYLPPDTVLLLATGSQGDSAAALNRLSQNRFRDMAIEPGDTVVFSSKVIPGNEIAVEALIARLEGLGATVFTDLNAPAPIHTSGHPATDELRTMYGWVQPRAMIPVHGEAEHLQANTQLARDCGIDHCLNGRNGDLFVIAPNVLIRRESVRAGRLELVGNKLQRVGDKTDDTATPANP